MKAVASEKISLLALVLLITGSIDSVRNLPATALFGSSLIFFFVFSAIVFLIPVALIAAELAACWPEEEGGIYSWVKLAFGESAAFIAIWLQWINTMVWYPTILSFIAGTLAYLIDPALAQNKYYLIAVILVVFWSLTFLGITGIRTSAGFASICTFIGMIIPMIFIIGLAAVWLVSGKPLAIALSWHTLLPNWHDSQSWVSLTAIMTAFLGMELAAVHVQNIHNPQKNFPKAILFSALLILGTMILGSLAIAFVLPAKNIDLVSGVMQAFTNFLNVYHLSGWLPALVVLLLIGSIGGMVNWIISPAKGLMVAAQYGYLPKWLSQVNRHGVAAPLLLVQALLVTLLCGVFLLLPSVNAIYWLFTALSTELYVLMYVLMFLAAWRLHQKYPNKLKPFKIPGGQIGFFSICILGLLGCIMTLIVGFIPPESSIYIGDAHYFRILFASGITLMLLPAALILFSKKRLSSVAITQVVD